MIASAASVYLGNESLRQWIDDNPKDTVCLLIELLKAFQQFFRENIDSGGRKRTDILYSNLDKTIQKGIEQTLEYSDTVGVDEHHLLIFNRKKKVKWKKKIWQSILMRKKFEDIFHLGVLGKI